MSVDDVVKIFFFQIKYNVEALEGGPSIPYPFNYFEKISHIPKINTANILNIQKALYPHIPKIDLSIPYFFLIFTKVSL